MLSHLMLFADQTLDLSRMSLACLMTGYPFNHMISWDLCLQNYYNFGKPFFSVFLPISHIHSVLRVLKNVKQGISKDKKKHLCYYSIIIVRCQVHILKFIERFVSSLDFQAA